MSRLAVSCALLLGATALAAACSVYDESLLGAGGVDDTSSSKSGKGNGGNGDGGAGPTTTTTDGPTTTTDGPSSSSDSSTGQQGPTTTGAQCDIPDDCPGDDTGCAQRSCEGNQCGVINEEVGFVLPDQVDGDCLVQICDGQGNAVSDVDDADLPDQSDECVLRTCNNGVPGEENAPERDPCGTNELCDGAGECVACLEDEDCDESCSDGHVCVQAECDDTLFNGEETDTDCGGPDCAPCPNGSDCDDGTDCVSGSCNGTCQPSCTDGLQNNGETDVDCGGTNCDECGLGDSCGSGTDCDSGLCLANACRPDMFLSEYVHGSGSNNKALEIFNYGNTTVDLAAATCTITVSFNGGTSTKVLALTGTVAPFETHVVCKNGFDAANIARCDQLDGSQTVNFNGNDAITLSCASVPIDIFGQVGTDPGTAWGSGATSAFQHTLRRKGSVFTGDRNGANSFDPATEWDGYAIDTFSGLGDHP